MMPSLITALRNKGITGEAVASRVESFLSLDDMGSWRQTSKQAFQDVEAKVKKEDLDLGSIWYLRFKHVSLCLHCGLRWSLTATSKYNIDKSDFSLYLSMCPDCFVNMEGVGCCVNCNCFFLADFCYDHCRSCQFLFCK